MAHTNCLCPSPEILHPCKCDAEGISCGGKDWFNLIHVFENINQNLPENEKHFKKFYFNNTAITELEENTFSGITFDEIIINDAINLKSINTHAFDSTNLITKGFFLWNAPVVNTPPYFDIFRAFSSMINLEQLNFQLARINEIPSYAFRPINGIQSKLSKINFSYSRIKMIGNYSFYDLQNLSFIAFPVTPLEYISTNAFHFRNDSNQTFDLHLEGIDTLNGSSFAINSLSNINRPTKLGLYLNPNFKFFDEKVFLPFLESNPLNRIVWGKGTEPEKTNLDCDDCRSYWLVKDTKYFNRFDNLFCANGNDFRSSANFKGCK
jgi:hypothetical protein